MTRKITINKEVDFFENIIFLYKPYWPLFVLLTILFAGAAKLYLGYAIPVYESTARVLIKDERKGVEEAKTVESLDGFSAKKIIENEIEVLKSPSLVDDVVIDLGLYAPVYVKSTLQNRSAYKLSPVRVEVDNPAKIKKQSNINFTYDPGQEVVHVGNVQYPLNKFVSTNLGNIRFIKNPRYDSTSNQKEGAYFFNLLPPANVSNSVNGNLVVTSASKLSSILYLKYKDEVPERGEDILNSLLKTYNTSGLVDKNTLTTNTLNFIDTRLALLRQDLDTIERKIQRYKSNAGAVDIGTQGRLFLENVSNNDRKLSEINMQLAVLNQVDKYVTSKGGSGGIVPSTLGVNDPTLSQLVSKLYSSELEYETVKKTAGENNPVAVSLSDQIEKIRPGILENIESQRSSLLASRYNLAATNGGFVSTLQAMPEKERQLIDINREQGTKNQIYNFLLQKREETALSHASTVSNNKIVDMARSGDNPVSPKRKMIYMAAFLLALVSSMFIVLVKEKLRGQVMFIRDIEGATTHPVIGEITVEDSRNPIVVGDGKRTLIAEQFRKIRATFNFLGINPTHKRVMVTSSISGEGKSFVAVNLALSLAMAGKKVALLDFDLNNPSLNNKLSILQQRGITEYLQNECTADQIIYATDHHPNLFLLPTGELPSNPAELIMNGRTEALLNYLDTQFDNIIIDIAPVGPVTDAYLVSPFCDATLFIIRHGYTPKAFVERIDINNKIYQLKNIAIIFNCVGTRGFGQKNYGYGYGYQHSYGYGNTGSKKLKLLTPPTN